MQIRQPVRREEIAVLVEAVAAAEDVFQHDRRVRKPEFRRGQVANFRHGVAGQRIIGDRPVPVAFAQDSSQVGDSLPLDAANVALEKFLITQSDVETLGPVSDKGRRAHLIDVIEPHVLQHIIEEFQRRVARQVEAGGCRN